MSESLTTKYRPSEFSDVLGHEDILNAVQRSLETETHPHAFLLTGPSGTGKTTIARIIGKFVRAEVIEIDAASNSGVDAMRDLVELGAHVPLGGGMKRMVIIDECHVLSKNAWQALLKILEEPPPYLYFALCTTESHKVPTTIKTRAFPIELKAVPKKLIGKLIDDVCKKESIDVSDDIWHTIVQESSGSPRMALNLLQALRSAGTLEEAERIIKLEHGEDEPVKKLARKLYEGNSKWTDIQSLLLQISEDGVDAEQAMIGMARYMVKIINTAKKEEGAERASEVLNALIQPTFSYDALAVLSAAVTRVFWRKY